MIIAIDFDGTCVSHEFPAIGSDIGAVPILKALVAKGHQLILFTMRSDVSDPISANPDIHLESGNYLTEAVEWFEKNEIPLYGIQTNPEQATWTSSPKAYANLYIDDRSLGIPLKSDPEVSPNPYVDWEKVEYMLKYYRVL